VTDFIVTNFFATDFFATDFLVAGFFVAGFFVAGFFVIGLLAILLFRVPVVVFHYRDQACYLVKSAVLRRPSQVRVKAIAFPAGDYLRTIRERFPRTIPYHGLRANPAVLGRENEKLVKCFHGVSGPHI
jgi:hypothetical protein